MLILLFFLLIGAGGGAGGGYSFYCLCITCEDVLCCVTHCRTVDFASLPSTTNVCILFLHISGNNKIILLDSLSFQESCKLSNSMTLYLFIFPSMEHTISPLASSFFAVCYRWMSIFVVLFDALENRKVCKPTFHHQRYYCDFAYKGQCDHSARELDVSRQR